ncbi:hypothetical protein AA0242T_0732 [Acetobacter aceti NRIC 0242]|uniref:Transposase n=1 Tax=Acetobacter aceti NBRC 14818 TaxID=887700 RepID=A0AB33IGI0_ACEAC|nr:hypothetical protein EMQ_1751 [Acetobacter aceti NBRC 14818]GAN57708.1 hypothetical protein Abac_018_121 [Acetobacter aceti NBRC 14818]GBO80030.1 hypothetical protein AA0242T_0732 [Acetobacter aceti NRIC 0242]
MELPEHILHPSKACRLKSCTPKKEDSELRTLMDVPRKSGGSTGFSQTVYQQARIAT